MSLASLTVKIGADLSELNRGLTEAGRNVGDLGKQLSGTGRSISGNLTAPIRTNSGAMGDNTRAVTSAGASWKSLREPLTSATRSLLQLNPAVSQVTSVLGSMALGTPLMVGALAGVAALAAAWSSVTAGAKQAAKEQQDAVVSIQGLRDKQRSPILGDVPHQRELLVQRQQSLTSDLALAQKMSSLPGPLTQLTMRAIYGDPEKIKREIAETTNLIQAAGKEISRLKAIANEPTRLAVLESAGKSLDIGLARERLRSQIGVNGLLTSAAPKSDLDLALQENAAKLAATKRQIDEQFRQIDAEGKVLALTREQQSAKTRLIAQAEELALLAERQARAEHATSVALNRISVDTGSTNPLARHKARLAQIEIERRAEIQKYGDIEAANRRANQKAQSSRVQEIQDIVGFGGGAALSLLSQAGQVGSVLSSTISGALSGASAGPLGALVGGAASFIGSLFGHKKSVDDNTSALNRLTESILNAPAGFKTEPYRHMATEGTPWAPVVIQGNVTVVAKDPDDFMRKMNRYGNDFAARGGVAFANG